MRVALFIKQQSKTTIMTRAEQQRLRKLQNNLTHGRGIFEEVWLEFIELRTKDLIKRGENPDDYDLTSRFCNKKIKAI